MKKKAIEKSSYFKEMSLTLGYQTLEQRLEILCIILFSYILMSKDLNLMLFNDIYLQRYGITREKKTNFTRKMNENSQIE